MPDPKLLVATHNPGKLREYRALLRDVPYHLVSLDDLNITLDVDETGSTFFENAWLKAHAYAAEGGLLTLADDSGLEVDALGGQPGVHSARFGGDACQSDEDRVSLLLRNLEGVPWQKRTARFRCVITLAYPPDSGTLRGPSAASAPPASLSPVIPAASPVVPAKAGTQPHASDNPSTGHPNPLPTDVACVVGSVAGMIQYAPEGTHGFGYDPVFYLPSFSQTIAQLPVEQKNRISHRSDAARRAINVLARLAATNP